MTSLFEYGMMLDELEINRKELWCIYSLNEGKNSSGPIAAQKALAEFIDCCYNDIKKKMC